MNINFVNKLKHYFFKIIKKSRVNSTLNSFVNSSSKVESGTAFVNSSIGRHSFVGYDCDIYNTHIGNFCSIANNVVIGGGNHPINWVSTSPVFYSGRDSVKAKFSDFERVIHKKTNIGSDVWIGQNVTIKQGINIGTGSVIGMGSIVTKDVIPYSVVCGNPARLLKMRFSDRQIDDLLSSRWWELSDSELAQSAVFIRNVDDFLSFIKQVK